MDVALFIPCFIDQLFPQTAVTMVRLLRGWGCAVHFSPDQTCCGQPAFNAGFWAEAKAVGDKWLRDMRDFSDMPIVCPSASCVGFLRNQLQQWAIEEQALFPKKVLELSEFIIEYNFINSINKSFPHKVAYHHSCAALNECKNRNAPLQILQQVRDVQLIEPEDADVCCGFGGTFSIKFEPISVAMAEKKAENALAAGAEYLVSTDLSCLMHVGGYVQQRGLPLKVAHLAEVIG